MVVNYDSMPAPLREAVERFERELQAIGYVPDCDVTYQGKQVRIVTWNDPTKHHIAMRDAKGFYEYVPVHGN